MEKQLLFQVFVLNLLIFLYLIMRYLYYHVHTHINIQFYIDLFELRIYTQTLIILNNLKNIHYEIVLLNEPKNLIIVFSKFQKV